MSGEINNNEDVSEEINNNENINDNDTTMKLSQSVPIDDFSEYSNSNFITVTTRNNTTINSKIPFNDLKQKIGLDLGIIDSNDSIRQNFLKKIGNFIYPVGSYYWNNKQKENFSDECDYPIKIFGGTWERIENVFLWAKGSGNINLPEGEIYHTLTIEEMPSHFHWENLDGGNSTLYRMGSDDARHSDVEPNKYQGTAIYPYYTSVRFYPNDQSPNYYLYSVGTENTGNGQSHNNMPPYQMAYCWRRTGLYV